MRQKMKHHIIVDIIPNQLSKTPRKTWSTSYSLTKQAFQKAGYSNSPGIVYWNIRSSDTFQCESNDVGVTTYGGFSQAMFINTIESLDVVINKETPWDRLEKTINAPRYDEVRDILSESNEGALSEYKVIRSSEDNDNDDDDDWDFVLDNFKV